MSYVSQNFHRISSVGLGWLRRPLGASAEIKLLRSVERVMWGTAAILLCFCAYSYTRAAVHQSHQRAQLSSAQSGSISKSASAAGFTWNTAAADQLWEETAPLGILEIPRLNISAVAEEGANTNTLDLSVGHIAKSAYPGQIGNAAFAAHRDTYFRNLETIQLGDKVTFKSLDHNYNYQVASIKIVDGNDTSVLADTPQSTVTLITCYPFRYIGTAPKRFVVTATQISN